MVEQPKTGVKSPMLAHMGILVKDIDRALEYYGSNFGWGHLEVTEVELKGYTFMGKPGNCRLKVAIYPGPIVVEIFQHLEGEPSPYDGFLEGKTEFLHHIGFAVDDLDKYLADLAKRGVKPMFHHVNPEMGFKWVYINSNKAGGIIYELLESKKYDLKDALDHLPDH